MCSLSVGRKNETSEFVDHNCGSARRSWDNARTSRLTLEEPAYSSCSYGVTLGVAKQGISKSSPLSVSTGQNVNDVDGAPVLTFNSEHVQVTPC